MWTRAVETPDRLRVGPRRRCLPLLAVVGVGLIAILAACSPPGAPTNTLPPSSAAPTRGAPHNQADVIYTQMMIISHEGATDMAGLAQQTSTNEHVRAFAERVNVAKGPEINQMRDWLETWGEPLPETSDMGSISHDGVGSGGLDQQPAMNTLRKLGGAAFDKKFLRLMLAHHRAALGMAAKQVGEGRSPEAIRLATNMITTQQGEIAEIESLLGSIGSAR